MIGNLVSASILSLISVLVGKVYGVEVQVAAGIAGLLCVVISGFEVTWKKIEAISKTYERETK
jgi:uncharacterized membrane protein YjjP (DUF1212 family)